MSKQEDMNKKWTEDEKNLLLEHLNDKIEDVCKLFPDRSFNSVHVMWKRMRHKHKISDIISKDFSKIKEKEEEVTLQKKYKSVLKENEQLQKLLAIKESANNAVRVTPFTKKLSDKKTHVIGVAPLSDVHAGKVVTLDTTFGLNEYNINICDKRLSNYFNNIVKLLNMHQQHVIIDKFIFAPIGDLIDGYIHEENMILNELSSIEALIWMQNKLISGIEFILKETDIPLIEIPFVTGN